MPLYAVGLGQYSPHYRLATVFSSGHRRDGGARARRGMVRETYYYYWRAGCGPNPGKGGMLYRVTPAGVIESTVLKGR